MEEECTSCNHHWTTLHNVESMSSLNSEPELPDIPLKQHEGYRIIDHGGTIWLTGGFNVDSIAPSKSVYYLTEENRMKWYQAPSTKEARYFHVTAVLNDCLGKLLGNRCSKCNLIRRQAISTDLKTAFVRRAMINEIL